MGITGFKTAVALTLTTALALSACGGDSNKDSLVTADTQLLLQNAARHSGDNLGINLNAMASMANDSTVSETLFKSRKTSAIIGHDNYLRSEVSYDEQAQDYLLPTLNGGNATQLRDGNTITINPDEQYVCTQWLDGANTQDINDCATVLSDLTVQITVSSDDTGTLRYLYSNDNLITIQYAPSNASYEVFLPIVGHVLQRAAEVTGDTAHLPDTLPDTLTGALKFATRIDNAIAGQEAGNLSVAVTQPIEIADSVESYQFTLGRSVLFDVTADATTGDGSISLGITSLYIALSDFIGPPASSTTIEMPDFTMTADLTNAGTQVLFSNFGMGRGPFTMANNGNPVVSLSLDKFSARYNDLTRHAEFLSNMSLDIAIDYTQAAFGWLGDESSLRLSSTIPGGTELSRQLNGSVKVDTGGPVSYQYSYVDGSGRGGDFQQDMRFTTGQCFQESRQSDGLDQVSCN